MVKRDTQILPVIKETVFKKVGVIGVEPKCGATFICKLLEQMKKCFCEEKNSDEQIASIEIVDMGDTGVTEDLNCVLIVMDCRNGFQDKVIFAIKAFKRKNIKCALILNRWFKGFEVPQSLFEVAPDLASFKIPVIGVENLMDLFNFTFYN